MKPRPLRPQPAVGGVRVPFEQVGDQRVEGGAVMHMDAVRDLMRDGRATNEAGGEQ